MWNTVWRGGRSVLPIRCAASIGGGLTQRGPILALAAIVSGRHTSHGLPAAPADHSALWALRNTPGTHAVDALPSSPPSATLLVRPTRVAGVVGALEHR